MVVILCGLKRIKRDYVMQMSFLISVRIRDIQMRENRLGRAKWKALELLGPQRDLVSGGTVERSATVRRVNGECTLIPFTSLCSGLSSKSK